MASERKRQANRRNAQKSTGPRTARGKSIVSRNALRHGLMSQRVPVLPFENEFEYRALADAMERDLRPKGILQREVVTQLTQTLWKLRRIPAIEAALFEHDFASLEHAIEQGKEEGEIPEDTPMPEGSAAIILAGHFARADRPYERLEIYRARLERGLHTLTTRLEKLRGQTAGEEIDPFQESLYMLEDVQRLREKTAPSAKPAEALEPEPSGDAQRAENQNARVAGPYIPFKATAADKPLPDHEQRVDESVAFCGENGAAVFSVSNDGRFDRIQTKAEA